MRHSRLHYLSCYVNVSNILVSFSFLTPSIKDVLLQTHFKCCTVCYYETTVTSSIIQKMSSFVTYCKVLVDSLFLSWFCWLAFIIILFSKILTDGELLVDRNDDDDHYYFNWCILLLVVVLLFLAVIRSGCPSSHWKD